MKVKELVEVLLKFDQEETAYVIFFDSRDTDDIITCREIKIDDNRNLYIDLDLARI